MAITEKDEELIKSGFIDAFELGLPEGQKMAEKALTVSIGVAYCGKEQVRNYDNIIDRADNAVYAAKRAGRNKVCVEQKEMQVK
ncbi:MAG: diguanylate cyclase [Oscillospiraceae bacterium]|nr:diguanylate cyclase [Oscillospiraceae bacterium]